MEAELPPERDSPAAQAGSEPQVSHEIDATIHSHPDGPPALLVGEEMATPLRGGTTSSNPLSSTGESNSRVNFATAGSFVDEVAMVGDTDPAAWGQDDSAWPH